MKAANRTAALTPTAAWIRLLVIGGLLGLVLARAASASDADLQVAKALSNTFATVAERVGPCVVHVQSEQVVSRGRGRLPIPRDQEDLFRRFFGEPEDGAPRQFRVPSQGSGFILDAEGHVLTNNHVVENAKSITIHLPDKRQYEAEVVGRDPKSDIAVLQIKNPDADLPVCTLGDSAGLRVGEIVIAIGSPFGLDKTVTTGIVSAIGRDVGMAQYENYIQTDAAINPGNSGGPLINLDGEVIGINTAITSRSGGNNGVGFAIPVNMAKRIVDQLLEFGKVTRGWIGVGIQDIESDMVDAFEGLEDTNGVLITQVGPGMPADQAGIQPGDILLAWNGVELEDTGHLRNLVANTPPGTEVPVRLLRQGETKTVRITPTRQPKQLSLKAGAAGVEEGEVDNESLSDDWGFEVQSMTPSLAEEFGYEKAEGVLIQRVDPAGPAARANLRPGMLILEVNQQPVSTLEEFVAVLEAAREKDRLLMRVRAGDAARFLVVKRREADDE
jgi:serine protease Do